MTKPNLILPWRRMLCGVLAASALTLGPAPWAHAELIATDAVLAERSDSVRAEWMAMIEREDVRSELTRLGVDPVEARARVASLTDAEVAAIQGQLDEVPAGASFVGAVAGVLLVTVTVLVFTELLGYTDVFPFITPLPRRGDSSN